AAGRPPLKDGDLFRGARSRVGGDGRRQVAPAALSHPAAARGSGWAIPILHPVRVIAGPAEAAGSVGRLPLAVEADEGGHCPPAFARGAARAAIRASAASTEKAMESLNPMLPLAASPANT